MVNVWFLVRSPCQSKHIIIPMGKSKETIAFCQDFKILEDIFCTTKFGCFFKLKNKIYINKLKGGKKTN